MFPMDSIFSRASGPVCAPSSTGICGELTVRQAVSTFHSRRSVGIDGIQSGVAFQHIVSAVLYSHFGIQALGFSSKSSSAGDGVLSSLPSVSPEDT